MNRLQSFKFAFKGLLTLVKSQPNARIHLLATLAVIIAGILLQVTAGEWCSLTLAMTAVWVAEALNTAIEQLADAVSPDFHPAIARAKDVAAAAVLIAALGAVIIAILVLGPPLLSRFV